MANLKRGSLRLLDSFTFSSGARQTMDLNVPARYMQTLWMWLRGTLTISATTVLGTVHIDGPANIIGTVELLVGGKTYKIGSFPAFLRAAQKYYQTEGQNAGLTSGADGAYNFEVLVPLMFQAIGTISPMDTLIDGRFIKKMTLNITWQTAADLLVGETSTLALTSTTCQVYMMDTEPFPVDAPFYVFRETETTHSGIVTSSASRLELSHSPNGIMRFIQLRAIDGSDLSDAVINSYSVRLNGEEYPVREVEDDFTQALGMYEYGYSGNPDGYYHIELVENGRVFTTGLGSDRTKPIKDIDVLADTTVGAGATSIVSHIGEHVPAEA